MDLSLAVVSNSDGRLEEALDCLGLARYFDSILDSAVVGVEKPDPEIFRIAAREVGVAPEQAVHVGDLYWIDVLGARAAGVEPVLLDPGGIWPQTDCVRIGDLEAVPELVRRAPDFRGTIL
jgi:HAD superfamily hydrolase (TIGR01509 family)